MNSALSDDEKIAVFRKIQKAWETKDWRTVADSMTEDGMLHSMAWDPVVGRENFYERMTRLTKASKTVRFEIERLGVIDGAVVVERCDVVTIDGVSRSIPVVGILEFDGSLISRWREYFDSVLFLRAQGQNVETQKFTRHAD